MKTKESILKEIEQIKKDEILSTKTKKILIEKLTNLFMKELNEK